MSYCRTPIYVYHDVTGYIDCATCNLPGEPNKFPLRSEAIAHLKKHEPHPHILDAIERLQEEIETEGDPVN